VFSIIRHVYLMNARCPAISAIDFIGLMVKNKAGWVEMIWHKKE
jgi:Zn ribbon nucleic-acid-binding protein